MWQPMAIGSGTISYLLERAHLDYFLEGGEPPGRFLGTGAELLFGQSERPVQREELRALLEGLHPQSRQSLVQEQAKKERQTGWHIILCPPKSYSTLWSQVDEQTRLTMLEDHAEATKAVIQFVEQNYAFTRRGKDGKRLEKAKLIVTAFRHHQSRAGDPLIHEHLLIPNLCFREDGTTGTVVSKPFYEMQKTLGAIYRADLAARLEKRLGVRGKIAQDGWSFTFRGHNKALDEEFSKRSKSIKEELRTQGSAPAREAVARSTRPDKDERPLSEKLTEWKKTGESFGYSPKHVMGRQPRLRSESHRFAQAWKRALSSVTREKSHFTEHELLEHVAIQAQGLGLSADAFTGRFQKTLKKSLEVIDLGQLKGHTRYTTKSVYRAEKRLIQAVDKMKLKRHGVRHGIVQEVLREYEKPRSTVLSEMSHHARQLVNAAKKVETEKLNRAQLKEVSQWTPDVEQRQAIRALTRKGSGIRALEGWAGTGKTSMLRVANDIWKKGGYKVIGVTVSGKAADELARGSGIDTCTIETLRLKMKPTLAFQAKFHARQIPKVLLGKSKRPAGVKPFKFDKKTVLVIDEVSMVETHDLVRLVRAVQRAGGMVVISGDRRQLPAIGRGGGGAFIADRVKKVVLSRIRRQKDELDRQAVRDLGTGEALKALKNLSERGKIQVAANWEEAKENLVSDWARREKGNRRHAQIYVAGNEDRTDINRRCQAERVKCGELSGKPVRRGDNQFYKGDRVIFRENSRNIGVRNGSLGTIRAFLPTPIAPIAIVKLDAGKNVLVPLASYEEMHPGYAVTAWVGQGSTNRNAYHLLGGSSLSREMAYVQGSRHKENIWLYTDRAHAGADLNRLAKLMSRSREKTLAHDIHRQIERERLEIRNSQLNGMSQGAAL